jgi:SAM-dependent methyltransferase
MYFITKSHNSKTIGYKQLKIYKYRSHNIRLAWCKSVLDIIKNFNVKKINDLGCNYFQLFKEMQLRKLKYDYFGYDFDKEFIKIGLNYLVKIKKNSKKFKNKLFRINNLKKVGYSINGLKFNYEILNVEKEKLRTCDCSVLSAILEHTDYPYKVLQNAFKTTRKIIILRTFIDLKKQNAIQVKNVKHPYNIRRFGFNSLKKIFSINGFDLNFILDEATKFSTKSLYVNNNLKNQRKFYIGLAVKK